MANQLFIFLSIWCCLSSSSIDVLQTHFPKLIEYGDEIVLHFYEQISIFTNHNNGHFVQQLVLTGNFSALFCGIFSRHIKPVNIIITAYSQLFTDSEQTSFSTLRDLFMSTGTVVLYIKHNDNHDKWNCKVKQKNPNVCLQFQTIIETPSFKAILTVPVLLKPLQVHIICNGYCSNFTSLYNGTPSDFLENNKKEILKMHKSIFYSAENKKIPAFIAHSNLLFREESIEKLFSCDKAYKNRKYNLMRRAKYC